MNTGRSFRDSRGRNEGNRALRRQGAPTQPTASLRGALTLQHSVGSEMSFSEIENAFSTQPHRWNRPEILADGRGRAQDHRHVETGAKNAARGERKSLAGTSGTAKARGESGRSVGRAGEMAATTGTTGGGAHALVRQLDGVQKTTTTPHDANAPALARRIDGDRAPALVLDRARIQAAIRRPRARGDIARRSIRRRNESAVEVATRIAMRRGIIREGPRVKGEHYGRRERRRRKG